MRTLHVTAHEKDAYQAFRAAIKFSTGLVRFIELRISWGVDDNIKFHAIRSLSDAHRLAGYYFDQIIFDTMVSDEIQAYLHSMVRRP